MSEQPMSEQPMMLADLATMAGVTIDLDATAIVSAVIFLVLMVLLNTLLFQPYLRLVEKREQMTAGAQGSAGDQETQAKELEAKFRAELASARAESQSLRDGLRAEGKAEAERIIAEARAESQARRVEARDELDRALVAANAEIDARASELAKVIAARMTTVKG